MRPFQAGYVAEVTGATTSEDSVNLLGKLAKAEGKKTRMGNFGEVAKGWLQR